MSEPVATDATLFPCPGCGAKTTYLPGSDTLTCEYCGAKTPITGGKPPVVEQSFEDAIARVRRGEVAAVAPGSHEVECKTCGARTVLAGQAQRCAFCDSGLVVDVASPEPIVEPQGVLPFAIEQAAAKATWARWISKRWFAPSDLAARADRGALDGVYLPYWTYDARTTTPYKGERGDHYYETETTKDAQGNTQTRQVRHTRWSSARGAVRVTFDDVLVPGTEALPKNLLNKLEPWDLEQVKPFAPAYLAGFQAQRYQIDLAAGFERAKERMEPKIEAAIERDIGGDEQRISWKQPHYHDPTFKHLLLPLWLSSYRYGDKVYRFCINARTGETSGERPYSAIKIVLFILAIVAVIAGLVLLLR